MPYCPGAENGGWAWMFQASVANGKTLKITQTGAFESMMWRHSSWVKQSPPHMSILQNLQAMFQRFVQYHNSAIIALAIVRTRNPQSWRTNLQAFSSRACKANSSLATWSIISSEISNRPGKAIKTNQASIGSSFGNLEGWGSSNINQHCSEGALAAYMHGK